MSPSLRCTLCTCLFKSWGRLKLAAQLCSGQTYGRAVDPFERVGEPGGDALPYGEPGPGEP